MNRIHIANQLLQEYGLYLLIHLYVISSLFWLTKSNSEMISERAKTLLSIDIERSYNLKNN